MQRIDREELRMKQERNQIAAIVDVLDPESFEDFHLPGAINVPLGRDFDEEIQRAVPDKDVPVVVYCMDENCDASPKAAERMEKLGYRNVYDYAAGKKDWRAAGFPVAA